MFLKPEKLQNHSYEGKGKEKKEERGEGKGEKKKKARVALLVFIIATLETVFGQKKLFDAKGPFSDNGSKNPARYKCMLNAILKLYTIGRSITLTFMNMNEITYKSFTQGR